MAISFDLVAEMEDGDTYTAHVDQRDLMRFEIQPFAGPVETHGHTFTRFVAFAALDRAGVLKGKNGKAMGWEAFNKACVEVHDAPEDNEEEAPKA
jgi:hypothetical protein